MHLDLIHVRGLLLLLRISEEDTRSVHRVTIGCYVILQEDILFLEVGWASLQKLQVVNELEGRFVAVI